MHRRTSHYPICVYLSAFFDAAGIKAAQFVSELGYRNTNGGIAAFDAWLQQGRGDQGFVDRFLGAFPAELAEVTRALQETEALMREEREKTEAEGVLRARRNFEPYIYLETLSSVPSSIGMFALTGGRGKFLPLGDSFECLSSGERIAVARAEIRKHQVVDGGVCPFFGAVAAYRLVPDCDSSLLFDRAGNLVKTLEEPFRIPFATYVTFA